MTPPFYLATPLLLGNPSVSLSTYHRSEVILHFYFGLKRSSWAEFLGNDPQYIEHNIFTSKRVFMRHTASFEPSHMFVLRVIRQVRKSENFQTKQSLDDFHLTSASAAHIGPMAMVVCKSDKVATIMIYVKFCA